MWRLALCLAACTRAASPVAPAPSSPSPSPSPSLVTVRDDAFGPLTAQTPATLVALRAALAGFDVAPVNAGSLEYRVSHAGATVFEIVPDDRGTILNIHVVAPDVVVAGSRVGAPFHGPADTCECWDDQTVCFRAGAHVAVGLAQRCREGALASAKARARLAGVAIRTLIWSPRPLAPGGVGPADAAP